MARGEVTAVIEASAADVFDLIHNYDRRLEWDTLLSEAYLVTGFTKAEKGARSVCVGRSSLGRIALETEYVSFDRPRVAAVKMVNAPPFFKTWAASIRHEDLAASKSSRITYTFNFTARPASLRWALEPVMLRTFRWETERRLRALNAHFQKRHAVSGDTPSIKA